MRGVLDLIAPTLCVSCGVASDGELCAPCAELVTICSEPWCDRCGHPGPQALCPCRSLDGFDRARSLVTFTEPARSLVLSAKRRGSSGTLSTIGSLLADLGARSLELDGLGAVTFVPGGSRSDAKGFDHAERIAAGVARRLGVAVQPLLRRAVDGPRQADVALHERSSNVAGRFVADGSPERVLLVDDVFTSGATANACGAALRRGGARTVDVLTFARTLRHTRRI